MQQAGNINNHRISFIGDLCTAPSLLMLVLLSELLAVAYTILMTGIRQFDFLILAYTSLFLLWASLGAAALLCRLRPLFTRLGTARSAGISFVLCLVWVAILSATSQYVLANLSGRGQDPDWWWVLNTVAVAAVLVGIGLRYAYLSLQLRQRQQSALHAQLDALHSRIRPHFLFNALNNISSLIAVDSKRAEQAVEDLAALFRANLSSGITMVAWEDERELCQSYLRIEQNRLGERLTVDWQEHGINAHFMVPSLLLQPLLENAIMHGIQPIPDGGILKIEAHCDNNSLTISVTNPIPANVTPAGNGMANDNIRLRLQTLYGARASLRDGPQGEVYIARLSLPGADH